MSAEKRALFWARALLLIETTFIVGYAIGANMKGVA